MTFDSCKLSHLNHNYVLKRAICYLVYGYNHLEKVAFFANNS